MAQDMTLKEYREELVRREAWTRKEILAIVEEYVESLDASDELTDKIMQFMEDDVDEMLEFDPD